MKWRRSIAIAIVALNAGLLFSPPVWAADFSELAALARSEQDSFRPVATAEAQRLADDCRTALQRLNEYLDGFDERERRQWRERLHWTEMLEQIQLAEPDAERLLLLSKSFYAPHSGLEADPFLTARSALDEYLHFQLVLNDKSQAELEREYSARVAELAGLLESSPVDQETLGEHVAWLDTLHQAPDLVSGLRDTFSHPNIVVNVSDRMLPDLVNQFQQRVARSRWSINTILGRRVEGMTHFTGQVHGSVLRDQPNTIIELTLTGTVRAPQSTAYAQSFRLYSQSQTAIQGTKRVAWDGKQLVAEPARVTASPATTLTGGDLRRPRVLPRSGLANRIDRPFVNIAMRQARQSQPQARREVASITARTVAREFDNAVREKLEHLNEDVNDYYTHPLARLGMLPDSVGIPTPAGLSLQFRVRGLSGLAAPLPPTRSSHGDIQVAIHESALTNLLQAYAGGDRWADTFFARIQKEVVGDYSVEMRIRENQERWSLTFDWMQPWSTRIGTEGVRFTLNASRFSIDGEDRAIPLVIRSTFVPLRDTGPAIGWERVGDVEIDSPARLDQPTRKFLHRKLSGFFMDRFFLDGLAAPAGGPWDSLSTVEARNIELADGWLRVTFHQTANGE